MLKSYGQAVDAEKTLSMIALLQSLNDDVESNIALATVQKVLLDHEHLHAILY